MLPAGSAGSSALFVVREQETTRVVVAPADTLVAGRVSVGTKPVAGATLEFTPRDRQSGAITVTTGANGRYSVALARPTQYYMFLQGKSAPTLTKEIDVAAGTNTVDWAVASGGSVTVRVTGVRPGLPTTVRIESRRTSHNGDLVPADEPVLTKDGLEFETYSVSATQGETLVSSITNVQLDADHLSAVVEVELVENQSSLIVIDQSGNPVRQAKVRVLPPTQSLMRVGGSIKETEPGVFPLNGFRPGMFAMIRADGLVPVCRTVPLNGTAYVELNAGRHVEARWPRDLTPAVVQSSLAALSDVPGSDCPVPFADFAPVSPTTTLGQPQLYSIEHFPSVSRLGLIRYPNQPRQVLVPDRGEVIVERD